MGSGLVGAYLGFRVLVLLDMAMTPLDRDEARSCLGCRAVTPSDRMSHRKVQVAPGVGGQSLSGGSRPVGLDYSGTGLGVEGYDVHPRRDQGQVQDPSGPCSGSEALFGPMGDRTRLDSSRRLEGSDGTSQTPCTSDSYLYPQGQCYPSVFYPVSGVSRPSVGSPQRKRDTQSQGTLGSQGLEQEWSKTPSGAHWSPVFGGDTRVGVRVDRRWDWSSPSWGWVLGPLSQIRNRLYILRRGDTGTRHWSVVQIIRSAVVSIFDHLVHHRVNCPPLCPGSIRTTVNYSCCKGPLESHIITCLRFSLSWIRVPQRTELLSTHITPIVDTRTSRTDRPLKTTP